MKPVLPSLIRQSRERRAKREALRPGWMCPQCGNAHAPTEDTCPEVRRREARRDIIR